VVGPRITVERGFETGEAKLGFIEGRIQWSVAVPGRVRDQLTPNPVRSTLASTNAPLVITAAEWSQTEFLTDRGMRRLPAWRLLAEGAMGPIWIFDPEVALWQPSGAGEVAPPNVQALAQDPGARIEIAGDDRTVTLHWLGAAPEYECYPNAETVEPIKRWRLSPTGGTADRGAYAWRSATSIAWRRSFRHRSAPARSLTCTATPAWSSDPRPALAALASAQRTTGRAGPPTHAEHPAPGSEAGRRASTSGRPGPEAALRTPLPRRRPCGSND
jgi:hypothetical protein